jgi:hypothetical protein
VTEKVKPQLESLSPDQVFPVLDLARPGLEPVRDALASGGRAEALKALLAYYRARYPLADERPDAPDAVLVEADGVTRNVFRFLVYDPVQYEEPIDWEWDPRDDIEWVAQMYRFHWARALAEAYAATREEKYVTAFVRLVGDWIARHPLEQHERAHRTLMHWKGFAWLDIQTGIRASALCDVFPVLVHGESFTPAFLGVFLASLYDHQCKSERIPMGILHNKAVMELRGLMDIAATFPEFRDTEHWLRVGLDRFVENFLGQTTSDGVQKEWSFGYHMHVLNDAMNIMRIAEQGGVEIPEAARRRAHDMYEFLFGFSTPELGMPLFGDTRRELPGEAIRSQRQVYGMLLEGAEAFAENKWEALANLDLARLPDQTSYAWPQAGLYAMRDRWGPDQIFFAFHDSPPALTGHDQDDNGTFELYAFGRWLMTDTGFYTYGHDAAARAWHRQTRVHQTLTLDGQNSTTLATHRLWTSEKTFDAVCVDNAAYEGLVHRRTIWFVNRRFFVLLDEAIGDAAGALDLHFQFAPGPVALDVPGNRAYTLFDDANVLVSLAAPAQAALQGEEGWFAWTYNRRVPRMACRFRLLGTGAPAHALTVIVPFQGDQVPTVEASVEKASADEAFVAGGQNPGIVVRLGNERWHLGRDLGAARAWCSSL